MIQCPYCGIIKNTWKAVQTHTNRCSKSDHAFTIHETVGLLHYSELYSNTLGSLQVKYSSTFVKSSIRKFKKYKLIDAAFTFKKVYDKEHIISLLTNLYAEIKRSPSVSDYQRKYQYPTSATVINKFGTWNAALTAAHIPIGKIGHTNSKTATKLQAVSRTIYDKQDVDNALQVAYARGAITKKLFNEQKDLLSTTTVLRFYKDWESALAANNIKSTRSDTYGIPTIAKDNHLYRSKVEAYFVDTYLWGKYLYDIEPPYPNSLWKYDWYIKELDLYIELAGGLRDYRIQEKLIVNKELRRNLLIVNYNDAYKYSSIQELINIKEYNHD